MAAADRELLEKSIAQASTWHKSQHLQDIQNVGWMSPESVTHAGDPNVTEYVEYEKALFI